MSDQEYAPLQLHVPEPTARPGDTPDFSAFQPPAAGEAPKPALEASLDDMRQMADYIIRVTDEKGHAQGPWAQDYSEDTLKLALRAMMRTRAMDDRMIKVQRQGKTSFYMKSTGEEAIGTGFQMALQKGDMNFPTYRQQSLLMAQDWPLDKMMNQVYSNKEDPCAGKSMPGLYSFKEAGYFSVSGNLGTQYIQAVGWAMASAMKGDTKISAAWIGDGATAENDFHSALVFASVYKPPVILNVVDNQWAISSFHGIAGAENASFAKRAQGYGIPALRVDGNDFLAVHAVSQYAAERVRRGHGPIMIEWITYRAGAHSSSDDPSKYRPANEHEAWPLGDPIDRLKKHMIARDLWSEQRHIQAEAEYEDEMREATATAEKNGTLHEGPGPGAKIMFEDVYEDMLPHLRRQRQELGV
ncbi:MAG: thiamine pyrophosphate-dependent enzyme [bacterium]